MFFFATFFLFQPSSVLKIEFKQLNRYRNIFLCCLVEKNAGIFGRHQFYILRDNSPKSLLSRPEAIHHFIRVVVETSQLTQTHQQHALFDPSSHYIWKSLEFNYIVKSFYMLNQQHPRFPSTWTFSQTCSPASTHSIKKSTELVGRVKFSANKQEDNNGSEQATMWKIEHRSTHCWMSKISNIIIFSLSSCMRMGGGMRAREN